MFTLPLTAAEYLALVDIKYSPNADALRGWALRDKDGRTHGWHPKIPGDNHWATADTALHAFLPTASERRKRGLLGWHVVPTEGIDDLTHLLHLTRGENPPSPEAHNDD
ncbi:hypothetical protein [Mycolicibacterium mageritense]|uniref:hypothetical protein n=1 Tax=Mycolicibacterium mageritense TaxID=53462 RepID=UPI0011D5049A|nr:hypothetical protein [Mycolicibacterium mageritense]TXI59032.1 MAG: hypothetical protein E6Q55_22345 [Mycolicibacterium mageritense]